MNRRQLIAAGFALIVVRLPVRPWEPGVTGEELDAIEQATGVRPNLMVWAGGSRRIR